MEEYIILALLTAAINFWLRTLPSVSERRKRLSLHLGIAFLVLALILLLWALLSH